MNVSHSGVQPSVPVLRSSQEQKDSWGSLTGLAESASFSPVRDPVSKPKADDT